MADERRQEEGAARPQEGSTKLHGDKLDPIIPRGADQRADDSEQQPRRGGEENELTGDRGSGAR